MAGHRVGSSAGVSSSAVSMLLLPTAAPWATARTVANCALMLPRIWNRRPFSKTVATATTITGTKRMDDKNHNSRQQHSHSQFVIPLPSVPVVPVASKSANGPNTGLLFPVHRIYCVARNYAEHAREMGGNPDQEPPFFFAKPPDAIVPCCATDVHDNNDTTTTTTTTTIPYPLDTNNLHYEIELVVALKQGGSRIAVADALDCVFGLAVGVDLTRRDLQSVAKTKGRPWCAAKGFDRSAPIGNLVPIVSTTTATDSPTTVLTLPDR